jgi:uncharacterized protein
METKIPASVQEIIRETREELELIYADHLKEIILFGSYARGDFTNESDINLILLLDKIDASRERAKYSSVISRISLKYDTVVSVIPIEYEEFHRKRTPLILNVNREGIKV